jgi:aerobic-type carbon monoxide dehydrogenase small subunit (CoxS/CutS family)
MTKTITLHVNGRTHQLQVNPETPLLYILRNDLGLKAAKFACGLEQCGACKVLIDGKGRPSCHIPVGEVEGRTIVTLEGLGTPEQLHPVQEAFLAEQAAQCGYCTAGMIVAAAALLDQNPHPSDADIRAAMARHLCRCGAYGRILKAVHRAAEGRQP